MNKPITNQIALKTLACMTQAQAKRALKKKRWYLEGNYTDAAGFG